MKYTEPYRKAKGHWVHRGYDIRMDLDGWTAFHHGRPEITAHTLDQVVAIIDRQAEEAA